MYCGDTSRVIPHPCCLHYKWFFWFTVSNDSSFLICYSCSHINVLQMILKSSRGSGWVIHHSSSTVSTRSPSFSYCLIQSIQWTFKYRKLLTAYKMDVCISQNIVTKLFPWDCYLPPPTVIYHHLLLFTTTYCLLPPPTQHTNWRTSTRVFCQDLLCWKVLFHHAPSPPYPHCRRTLSGSFVETCPAWEALLFAMLPPTLSCTEAHSPPWCAALLVWKSDMYCCVIELHGIMFSIIIIYF